MQAIQSPLMGRLCRVQSWMLLSGVIWLSGQMLSAQIDVIEDRLRGLHKEAQDVSIQINAINEFLQSADEKAAAIEEAIPQLEAMSGNLEDINQKNIIKVILQLAFETYSTIDSTTGSAKTAVQSFANHGITYAAGRLAFDQAGDEAKKAIGLDASSYYSSRNVSIQRLTDAAYTQATEVEKVHWALDKDLDYYRALKMNETGEDPGQRGAIFFKNQVVRDQIADAIDALQAMLDVIETEKANAASELEWLEAELISINSMIVAVTEQLEQAKADLREETITAQTEAILGNVKPPEDIPTFSFRNKDPDEAEWTYYNERFNKGVEQINDILDAGLPGLDDFWRDYTAALDEAQTAFAEWQETYKFVVEFRAEKEQFGPADFGNLRDTLWDRWHAERNQKELQEAERQLDSIIGALKAIESGFATFNQSKAEFTGVSGIASASAIPADVLPLFGKVYSLSNYRDSHPGTAIWGVASFSGLPTPMDFEAYYAEIYEMEEYRKLLEKALPNTAEAISAYKRHYDGLQSAIASLHSEESALVATLEDAVARMAGFLTSADSVASGRPYTFTVSSLHYHGLFNQQFTLGSLTEALKETLLADTAAPARALWDDYTRFVSSFESVDRQYRLSVQQALSSRSRIPGYPPRFRDDVEAAHLTADQFGFPNPSNSIAELASIAERFADAAGFVAQAEGLAEARSLPDVRVIEDMSETIPGDMEAPWIQHPLAQALPAYGLLLIKEEMDRRFGELMSMTVRDEDAMWDATYAIARLVDDWKAAQTDGILGGQLFHVADKIKGEQLYEYRQTWEQEFGVPYIASFSDSTAVAPGRSAQLSVKASSKFAISYAWYRRATFGEDERVGSASSVTVPFPSGLESYYCAVSNIHGTEYTGWIDVYPAEAPRIAFQPEPVEVAAGQPAQLSASFYLTVPAYVEESAAWYVSDNADPDSAYTRLPGSTSNILNIRSVVATRHYYYKVTNPWGTTRTEAVSVRVAADESAPVVIPPPENLVAYSNTAFSYQFTGAALDGFEWQAPASPTGLSFDPQHGVVSGTPSLPPGGTIHFKVRAMNNSGGQSLASPWLDVSLPVMSATQFPGTVAEQYFSHEQLQDASISGYLADPDMDGMENLLEFALGGNPLLNERDSDILPRLSLSDSQRTLHFSRPVAPGGFYHVVEYSHDLIHWETLHSLGGNPLSPSSGMETVFYQVPESSSGKKAYLRLRVVPVGSD